MNFTTSEELFEAFCASRSIRHRRIPRVTNVQGVQTPDYDIFLKRFKIVTEIKEIHLNAEERKFAKDFELGLHPVGGSAPGERVRGKISAAGPQIKSRSKGRYPGLLVLFDFGFAAEHIEANNIRAAMYGFETIKIAIPNRANVAPYAIGTGFGARRKMTADHNTSISAIAALTSRKNQGVQLEVFHNAHAARPIDPSLSAHYGIPQFRLAEAQPGRIAQWEKVSLYNAVKP